MTEEYDEYLANVGTLLAQQEIDVDQAKEMLSAPEIIENIDGSNVQQLIRLSFIMSKIDSISDSSAEVGVLLGFLKPDLEIDFGMLIGVARAQGCAIFAMHCIALQQGNIPVAIVTLESMIPSLEEDEDIKGLLETFSWLGFLYMEMKDYANAERATKAAISLLANPNIIDAILDNSALDMVREDNKNVFQFLELNFFQNKQEKNIAGALRQMLYDAQEGLSHE